MNRWLPVGLALLLQCAVASDLPHQGPGKAIDTDGFLAAAFAGAVPARQVLWLDAGLRAEIEQILGHRYRGMRVGYWQRDQTVALVLNEVGKEKPITIGVVTRDNQIERLEILQFRESRGWEVRYPFFTRQFIGAGLSGEGRLDRTVDGISGATLSVRAVTKVAAVALQLAAALNNAST